MINLKKFWISAALGLMVTLFAFTMAVAQGPPSHVDSCMVAQAMHFKALPVPGKFQPGEFEVLRACPSLGDCIVKISQAKAGKANGLRMELWMQGGKLWRVVAYANGKKGFHHLYNQIQSQAGRPSKLVDSQGVCAYNWDLGSKIHAQVRLHFNTITLKTELLMEAYPK